MLAYHSVGLLVSKVMFVVVVSGAYSTLQFVGHILSAIGKKWWPVELNFLHKSSSRLPLS